RTVEHAHHRHAHLACELLREDLLLVYRRVPRPTADREVIDAQQYTSSSGPCGSGQEIRRTYAQEVPVFVVVPVSGERTDLIERSVVCQRGDPFAGGQPTGLVLPGDLGGAAVLTGLRVTPLDLCDLVVPVTCSCGRTPGSEALPRIVRGHPPVCEG